MARENTRPGGWLPADRKQIADWVNKRIEKISNSALFQSNAQQAEKSGPFIHEEVNSFKDLLDHDPVIHLLAMQMIDQGLAYSKTDPAGQPAIDSYDLMLALIDDILHTAPEYMPPDEPGRGLIGFPINAILDWYMGTPAGYAFFLNRQVNECFGKILKAWCRYLCSPESVYVLNTTKTGWLCKSALDELQMNHFVCDPAAANYGFHSWNDFFTRKFKEGMRPVDNDPYVIVSACESTPYRLQTHVQKDTKFWLKGQPYSLEYMLNQDESAEAFVGGTVYQAFLSATRYHRWHSPVSGTIERCFLVPGTYYAEVNSYPYDEAGPNNSQAYITHVAARAVILIRSDNTDIGLMAFIAVGMAEVSSCILSVETGQHVEKGAELGYFQFGGSTHCLIFQKDVIDMFVQEAIPDETSSDPGVIRVCSKLAVAKHKQTEP